MARIGDSGRTELVPPRSADTAPVAPVATDAAAPTQAPSRPPREVTTDFTVGGGAKPSVAVQPPSLPTGRPTAAPAATSSPLPGGGQPAPATQRPLREVTYYRHGPTRDDVLTGKTLDVGAYGPAVTDVQHRLNAIGMKLPDGGRFTQDGKFGPKSQAALKEFQANQGLEPTGRITRETLERLDAEALKHPPLQTPLGEQRPSPVPGQPPPPPLPAVPVPPPGEAGPKLEQLPFTPNPKALDNALLTKRGELIGELTQRNEALYNEAARITGVPRELIAAVHLNESAQGLLEKSVSGPESGFGLDPRFVTTDWANDKLAKYGLSPWERGTGTDRSKLQSAVVAAEHIRRLAADIERVPGAEPVKVNVGPGMTEKELAAVAVTYINGPKKGRAAMTDGNSWMFDPKDADPHPIHPGGTSVVFKKAPDGSNVLDAAGKPVEELVPVDRSRKEGLLRWDVALPLIRQAFTTR